MTGQIQLFRFVQECYRDMGIDSRQPNEKLPFNWKSSFFLICLQVFGIGFLAFLAFKKASIIEYGLCFYEFVCSIIFTILFLTLRWQIPTISELIESIGKFIEKKNNKATYNELNEKIERISKSIHFALTRLTIVALVTPFLLTSSVNYFIFDLGADSFHLPCPVVLPFDWKTPFGYLVALIFEAAFVFCITFTAVPIFWLISDFNGIYEYLTTAMFAWVLLNMSSSLFVLEAVVSDQDSNGIEVISALDEAFWPFAITFIFCEFGHMVANQFEMLYDELCQCKWYSFSEETQKLYLTFITITQQDTNFQGFGNILCIRETSKKTTSTAFSYFTTLRKMNK